MINLVAATVNDGASSMFALNLRLVDSIAPRPGDIVKTV